MNLPEKWLILAGTLGSMVNGATMPLFAVVFSKFLNVFSLVDQPDELRSQANFYALMFVLIAVVCFFAWFAKIGIFALSGERLTKRLRSLSFRALLRQEMAYFDDPKNGTGALNARLSTEAEDVRGFSGVLVGNFIEAATSLTAGLIIAFLSGWKLTLVVLACMPLMVIGTYAKMRTLTGYGSEAKTAYEDSAQTASEAVENMRTVASLVQEDMFLSNYRTKITKPHKINVRGALLASVGFGFYQGLTYLVYSVAFYYGSRLVVTGEYRVDNMLLVLFAVVFSAAGLGQFASSTPNLTKAKIAALSIFDLLDRTSSIDPLQQGNHAAATARGTLEGRTINFSYPIRPEIPVLRGLDMDILEGKTVAFVGTSGCGKSTVVSLAQRFYDVNQGHVDFDAHDVRQWNLDSLRGHMSLVGQEPVLFDLSVGENIAYGLENPSQELIEQAAKAANIHDFVVDLPEGYDTRVGDRGVQLSGGQKQRVAIARAIIRNPRLLLLDEATSALDSENERLVQDALDRAAQGRTTIVIAHRLATVQTADLILVLKEGKVVESGTHDALLEMEGLYYALVQRQTLDMHE
jgi:ABC-type multidrug transport system fused ATPase/permease subunit